MNKLLIILFTLITSIIGVQAQALFYVPAGANLNNTLVKVFYYSNGAIIDVSPNDCNSSVKTHLMENPNYYEQLGKEKNGKKTGSPLGFGYDYANNLKFLRSNNGYNFYSQERNWSGTVLSQPKTYNYYAFSSNWNTLVTDPQSSNPQYWTRVDKSNFEISF